VRDATLKSVRGAVAAIGSGEGAAGADKSEAAYDELAEALMEHGSRLLGAFQRHLIEIARSEVRASIEEGKEAAKAAAKRVSKVAGEFGSGVRATDEVADEAAALKLDIALVGESWVSRSSLANAPACVLLREYVLLVASTAQEVVD